MCSYDWPRRSSFVFRMNLLQDLLGAFVLEINCNSTRMFSSLIAPYTKLKLYKPRGFVCLVLLLFLCFNFPFWSSRSACSLLEQLHIVFVLIPKSQPGH